MKETTITIKHAVAATRRQKWQQRNTNVNLNFFHNCRSDRSAALSHSHLRRRIVCDAARGCDVRVRACVHVYVCAVQCCHVQNGHCCEMFFRFCVHCRHH